MEATIFLKRNKGGKNIIGKMRINSPLKRKRSDSISFKKQLSL